LPQVLPHIDQCFTKNSVEEILKSLDALDTPWSKETKDKFKSFSPTSVKITFEQMSRGKKLLALKECLQMEYRLACRCCEDSDFYEGIRALLIDKDKNPKWQPDSIEKVTPDIINRYFLPLTSNRELNL
jgi:3-hydroxyisobutyryl-CoA hydrolase